MRSTFSFLVAFLMLLLGVQNGYAQPANDACSSAEPLVVGVGSCNSILYTNVAATSVGDPAVPACWLPNSLSHSVWFSFVATVPDIEISTNFGGTLANTQIAVYSGTCGALTFLGCQEDVNTAGGLLHTNMILHGLTVGNTYYILVDGNGNATGDFGICTQESLPVGPALPTQDCSGAQTLCNLGSVSVGNGPGSVGSSQEFPSCFGAPGERSSNWYTFTAATSGNLCFTISPNTNIDYDFAVYNSTASCPGVELSCNWSPTSPITGLGCTGVQCETCLTVTAGQTYSILVDRFTAASNSGFTLDFAGTTATFASPNPSFTATTACIGSPTQFTNTTNGNFTYSWNFGDGFTSNLENPSHTFATTGPHSVTLLLTAVPGGCQNSVTQTVTVNPLPTVNAGAATAVCSGGCVTLSGSTNAVGSTGPISFSNNTIFNIPDNDPTGVSSTINVSGITPATLSNTSIVSVCLDITHDFDGDLDIYLVAPNGTQIELSTDNGGGNFDYTNTCFSATATTAITAGSAPFTGTFTPEQAFSLLNGGAINGNWQLFVVDDSNLDAGTINNWSITLTNNLPAFTWTPTTAMTNGNTLSPTVCPTAPTTYTLTANNGPGCTATSQVTVGVTAGPTATIQYTSGTYCTTAAAQTVTLTGTGAYTGGTYSSTAGLSINTANGTITPSTSTPGPYTVSYTIPASGSCSAITVTTNVTITAPPVAGTLSGNQNICIGQTSSFASTSSGGSWVSSDVTVATINSASGLVTAVGAGTATMTYTVLGTGGCANVSDVRTLTVTAPPVVGTLSGNQNICIGQTSSFASTSSGGTWTSSDVTVANINSASGLVTAVGAGTATMTYTVLGTGGCANVSDVRSVTVTAPPIVGVLSGNQNICIGQTSSFASTSSGGSWASSDVTVATINSASGLVTAVGAGTATMTYTVLGSGGCANVSDVRSVTVNPYLSPVISCGVSSTTSVSFNWASVVGATDYSVSYQINAGAVVNIGPIGNILTYSVSGLTPGDSVALNLTPIGAAGTCFNAGSATCTANNCNPPTASISYAGSPFCNSLSSNQSVTLTGTGTFTGGTYSAPIGLSINTTNGDILPSASTPGPYTVTYTIAGTPGCPNVIATAPVTITLAPVAGTLSGNQNICIGQTSSFASTSSGGSWVSSDVTVATINSASGLVTAVGAGTATMTYTVLGTGGCANVSDVRTLTVTAPPVAGILSGNQNICVGQTSSFASTSSGGSWASSDVTVATINSASGLVTAVGAGTATMTYTVLGSGGCANVSATRTVTVTAPPIVGVLSGNQNICIGQISSFASTSSGGTWTSSDVTVASINPSSGLVTAVGAGNATMTYTVLGTGGCANVSDVRTLTVTAPPVVGVLSGNQNICIGQTSNFASTSSGGSWVSSDVTVATINSASGLVTAVGAGTATMTYTVLGTGGCANVSDVRTLTVTAPPIVGVLSGNQNICIGQTSSFSSTSSGGTWVSSDVTVATINSASGLVTAVGAGTATMTYTVLGSGGCANVSDIRSVILTAPPIAGTLSGNQNICQGSSGQFFSTVANGTWSSSDVSIASVNATTGVITGITAGSANITYTVNGTGGCANVSTSQIINIKPTPQVVIGTNPISICSENSPNITLTANYPGTTFSWTATQNNVSGAITSGTSILINPILTSTAINGGNVLYNIVPTLNGCTGTATMLTVRVNPKPVPTLSNGFICVDVATGNTAQGHLLNTGLGSANHNFQWFLDNVSIPINVNAYQANQAGIYSVIATNTATGCVSEEVFANVTATVFTTTYSTTVSEAFSDNPYIVVHTPAGSGPFEYQLDNGPWQNSNTFYNMIPGWHTIRIKDEVGCTNLEGAILILGYPKFFTPNDDGYNDTWNIDDLKDFPNSGIYIFDRYGKFIKQVSPLGTGWDGTYNGYPLPSTDYWFTVDFVDPNSMQQSTFKSHFSLKR